MSARGWIIRKLNADEKVEEVTLLDDTLIAVTTTDGKAIIAAVITDDPVTVESVVQAVSQDHQPDILVAVSNEIVWTGAAINRAGEERCGWGTLGELFRVINSENAETIQKKEYSFVDRALNQHNNVAHLERLFDRVFVVTRNNHEPLTVVLIYAYELTAEHIRHAREIYGDFDIVLNTNPNGNTTGNAANVATNLSAEIFKIGELLARLNRP